MDNIGKIAIKRSLTKITEDKVIWILTTALFSAFTIFDTNSYISYILFGLTALIFIIIIFNNHYKFILQFHRFQASVLVFAAYCAVTSFWARNSSAAVEKAVTIVEILICMTVLYSYFSTKESVKELLDSIRWAGYVVTIYAIFSYGITTIRLTLEAEERVGNSFANINSIAMLAAISLVLSVFNLAYYKFTWTILFSVPEIIMIAASGSRKSLIILGLGIVLVLLYRYKNRNIVKTILFYSLLATILFVAIHFLSALPMFAGINERMKGLIAIFTGTGEVEHSAWLRQQYMLAGLEQFKKTPILGVGIANSNYILRPLFGKDTYLHNNFVELLACGGVIGFGIYYYVMLWPLYKIWKNWKFGDSATIAVIILIFVLLLMDYGMVSYYSKGTYFYFMVFYLQVKILLRNAHASVLDKNELFGGLEDE